jgi:two-component system OmpR family sensor kinase
MKQTSIYKQFSQKLIFATSFFVIALSFIFYGFTKSTVYSDIADELISEAQLLRKTINTPRNENLKVLLKEGTVVDLVIVPDQIGINVSYFKIKKDHYIKVLYPVNQDRFEFIKLVRNINSSNKMLNKIFSNLLVLGIGGLILVIIYALAISKTLIAPIVKLTNKLSKMDENSLSIIQTDKMPVEFVPLANSINNLTTRIGTYVKYQKELFIGTAHELKTPLAVMKLKAQVTLRKQREPEKYIDTLNICINEIDGMNNMITSILDMGRQEGAQFEKPIQLDIIEYLKQKVQNYKLIASEKNINLEFDTQVNSFITIIQVTLLTQIIQNFVQNAIKFTPNGKNIIIKTTQNQYSITILVIDEGIGCPDDIDLFAPFKRVGKEKGAGLGLFLAKSAADTLGAKISICNRKDGISGTVAKLELQSFPACEIK